MFRYWKLESGNLTSSLTVMSPLVFVAVYDEIKVKQTSGTASANENIVQLIGKHDFNDGGHLKRCVYLSSGKNRGDDKNEPEYYCTY